MDTRIFTVYIEQDEDGMLLGSIPNLPGCHADGKTVEEVMESLKEIIPLYLRNEQNHGRGKFVGIQNLEVSYA